MWTRVCLMVVLGGLLVACENEKNEPEHLSQKHVWQGQVDTLNKAKGVEGMVGGAAERQRQASE